MSPKKAASKSKETQADPMESVEQKAWKPSKCTDFHLHGCVKDGLLHPHDKMQWRRAVGEILPGRNPKKLLLSFRSFLADSGFLPLISFMAFCITGGFRSIT
jgi:hypothetical protein